MAISVVMPALEMAQETGKLIAWRKQEGDRVAKGEPLLEIETDKAVVEIEAPADGILAGVNSREGAMVRSAKPSRGSWLPAKNLRLNPPRPRQRAAQNPLRLTLPPLPMPQIKRPHRRKRAFPPRRGAWQMNSALDVNQIRGTGPGGIITTDDVLAAENSRPPRPLRFPALPPPR